MNVDVAVVGTGAFARDLVSSLDAGHRATLRVAVLGRSAAAVRRVCRCGGPLDVVGEVANPFTGAHLRQVLVRLRPRIVVVAASPHSPYDAGAPAWREMLRRSGFGVIGLLQAVYAVPAAQAVAELDGTVLLNACYPDFVNPLLHALGLPVLAGLGNVQTLSAGLRARLGADGDEPAMLAHHRHLSASLPAAEDVKWWGGSVADGRIRAALTDLRSLPRRELNRIGAAAAGRLLTDLVAGRTREAHLPGPAGLPGGYPVRVGSTGATPRLPVGVTLEEAVEWNRRHAVAEGAEVTPDRRIRFSSRAAATLRELRVVDDEVLPAQDWDLAARRLLAARSGSLPSPPTHHLECSDGHRV